MTRCPPSIRSALIKFSRYSGPAFRSSASDQRGCSHLGRQFDNKAPALSPLNTSDNPHLAAFSRDLPFQLAREDGKEIFPSTGGAFSPQDLDRGASPRNTKSMNSMGLKEAPTFKLLETRWGQQSLHASSSFMFHPMITMPYRGLASGGAKDYAGVDVVTPTTPPDGGVHAVDAVRKVLVDYPDIIEISIPVSLLFVTWKVMPLVLRRLHGYMELGSAALLQDRLQTTPDELKELHPTPYELSGFQAAEAPIVLFANLYAVLLIAVYISPNTIGAEHINQFWTGGGLLCGVWFLHRWKTNMFKRLLSVRKISRDNRERYLKFDKFASLGLIGVGALGVARAMGMDISSLLAVGGIGGVATAFAAREILSNLLTGLLLSFSKPFTVGDTIKAGTVEGKVEEVGLISTRLLNLEKNPITVPNAFFTSQAIVNKSRAPWRSLAAKIPIRLNDFETIPRITMEIQEMLYRNPQVFLDEDKPRCSIAQFSPSALEIAIACNIKPMDLVKRLMPVNKKGGKELNLYTAQKASVGHGQSNFIVVPFSTSM